MSAFRRHASVLAVLLLAVTSQAAQANPVQKVLTLLNDLESKITKEGQAEESAYKEFVKWCDDASANVGFEIKTATAKKGDLRAALAKFQSDADVAVAKIGDLAEAISAAESDLANSSSIREKEHADFLGTEEELMEAVNVLERAITILEREMSKNPAFLQKAVSSTNMQSLLNTLDGVINAAAFSINDRKTLTALVQSHQGATDAADAQDSDSELGAPAAAVYKSHGSNIVEVLEDMKEKAEGELADLRKSESEAGHNYAMLKQSLTHEGAALSKEMGETKSDKAESEEGLAQTQGDLNVNIKDLASAVATQETVKHECATAATDHESSVASRAEELAALAKATEVLVAKTGGAEDKVYSFLQVSGTVVASGLHTRADLAKFEIVTAVKKLADKQHSGALAQLASRIGAVLRFGTSVGEDPFAKVKSLITEMIERLQKEANAEASHKAYCDEEMSKTAAKKADLTSDVDSLSAKIDKATAASTGLQAEVAELEQELATLIKMQAEMDKARVDEHAAFVEAESDLTLGLEGVQEAIRVLRDHYATDAEFLQSSATAAQPEMEYHSKADGAGSSIISILEVISSDFSRSLAEETVTEDEAAAAYEKMTQENKITKVTKEQDVKYKSQEVKGLEKAIAEHSSDHQGLQTELAAVLEYGEKLVAQCVAKPETYEERKSRRQAEIEGLKDALKYLDDEAFLQQGAKGHGGRHFRSVVRH